MNFINEFRKIIEAYDQKHIEKQRKNPRYYRNPSAAVHYEMAIARADRKCKTPTNFDAAYSAIIGEFLPDFWPVRKFKKKFGTTKVQEDAAEAYGMVAYARRNNCEDI